MRDLLMRTFLACLARLRGGGSSPSARTLPPLPNGVERIAGWCLKVDPHGRRMVPVFSPAPRRELASPSTGEAARRSRAVALPFDKSKHRPPVEWYWNWKHSCCGTEGATLLAQHGPFVFPPAQTATHRQVFLELVARLARRKEAPRLAAGDTSCRLRQYAVVSHTYG